MIDDASDFSSPNIEKWLEDTSYTLPAPLPDGTYYWRVLASDGVNASEWSETWSFTVVTEKELIPTNLVIDPTSFTLETGEVVTLTATLCDNEGTPLGSKTISWFEEISTDGETWTSPLLLESTVTDPTGDASLTYYAREFSSDVLVKITALFEGDEEYWWSTATSRGTVKVSILISTTLTIEPASFTLTSGEELVLVATLRDAEGKGIANRKIVWESPFVVPSETVTDAAGQATATFTAPFVTTEAREMVKAYFAGDENYQASSGEVVGIILPQEPEVAARFSPPHSDRGEDLDDDGYFDYLRVTVYLDVSVESTYSMWGSLHDSVGNYITHAAVEDVTLKQGPQVVLLDFSGSEIYRWGADGPYKVYLDLLNADWKWITSDVHETQAYSHAQFQPSAISFSPPHQDYGSDEDNDGYFDALIVEVQVKVGKAGKYQLSGSLQSFVEQDTYLVPSEEIGWAWVEEYLSTGTHILALRFDGKLIRRSGVDGYYQVWMSLFDEARNFCDRGEYKTSTYYSHMDFEPPSARFSPPHSDYGEDADGDGLFDYLVVEVNLKIEEPGVYGIGGSLLAAVPEEKTLEPEVVPEGVFIDHQWRELYLDGDTTVQLRFNGMRIHQLKLNGPYVVDLFLEKLPALMELLEPIEPVVPEHADFDTHITGNYLYTQFQTPAVLLSPPHSDRGEDLDNDGYFDYLVVDIRLKIAKPGFYTVSGTLMGRSEPFMPTPEERYAGVFIDHAFEDIELGAGEQTVRLSFSGSHIRQARINGPYVVELEVRGPHVEEYGVHSWCWERAEFGRHETKAYAYTDFCPPAASLFPPHSDRGVDEDGDNFYDYLEIEVKLQVNVPRRYHVSGMLESKSLLLENMVWDKPHEFMPPIHAWEEVDLEAGEQVVKLRFSGTELHRAGLDGPYVVHLHLEDAEWNWLGHGLHETKAYRATDFEPPPIQLVAPHTDHGVDLDGNGLYDFLQVEVTVDVRAAGTYLIGGILMPHAIPLPPEGEYVLSPEGEKLPVPPELAGPLEAELQPPITAVEKVTLAAGIQTVLLRFPGELIHQSKLDGPYTIELGIIKDFGTWEMFDMDLHRTSTAYEYTQFEPPAVGLTPPHVDYGLDTDNDGLYDALVVKVKLNVRKAGKFKLLGCLMDPYGAPLDRTAREVDLEVGADQWARLEFEGWKIYSSHVRGKLAVALLLLDPSVGEVVWAEVGGIKHPLSGWMDMDVHTTKVYSYDQFQPVAPEYSALVRSMPVKVLKAGEVISVELPQLPTLEEIRVIAEEIAAVPRVSVIEEVEVPPEVPELPGKVISYITIEVENAKGQSFAIKLSRERIAELGVDIETLGVFRLEDNWVEMEVENLGSDDDYLYFEVITPGFSLFAVTAEPPAAVPTLPTQPFAPVPPFYLVVIVAIILIGIIAAIVWRYISIGTKGLPRE
jgi:PGF-pre-PGF domain-containing protein